VKVVQQLALIINTARNYEQGVFDSPSGALSAGQVEDRLRSILDQCSRILSSLSKTGKLN